MDILSNELLDPPKYPQQFVDALYKYVQGATAVRYGLQRLGQIEAGLPLPAAQGGAGNSSCYQRHAHQEDKKESANHGLVYFFFVGFSFRESIRSYAILRMPSSVSPPRLVERIAQFVIEIRGRFKRLGIKQALF